ncbi:MULTISPECIES: metal-sulfur cluster assembly factor [Amycolatopsis]|uniref:metal-sulfur cluster assembly factor n=1 Tax=Amycolatopsis TaxID=1813 RepID=UPI0007DED706|nr:metal-sulfur cluster assembly factor [Amycolatopsis sp. M39]OAP21605.1 hypothetical protein A4R44_07628 [Amycolatopsis sp. M39]
MEPEPGSAAEAVREALCDVLDPDLGVNIVDLGFIRGIGLDEAGIVSLTMTLTSAACPLTGIMTDQINRVLVDEPEAPAKGVHIEWAWTPGDSSAEGREQLRAIGFTRF